jgi:hypothetical protein
MTITKGNELIVGSHIDGDSDFQQTGIAVASNVACLICTVEIFDTSVTDAAISSMVWDYGGLAEVFSQVYSYQDNGCDGILHVYKLDNPTALTNKTFHITFGGTVTDAVVSVFEWNASSGVIEVETLTGRRVGQGGANAPITYDASVAGDALIIGNFVDDQSVGSKVTLVTSGAVSIHITDMGSDTSGAAYHLVSGAGSYGLEWYDSDEDEYWVASCVAFRENTLPTVALNSPTNLQSISDTTPDMKFTGTDDDGDEIEYQIQIDDVNTFDSIGSPVGVNTYYIDGSAAAPNDPDNVWAGETNIDDGLTTTAADSITAGAEETNEITVDGTNAPAGTSVITQVRARTHGRGGETGSNDWSAWTVFPASLTWEQLQGLKTASFGSANGFFTVFRKPDDGYVDDCYNPSGSGENHYYITRIEIEVTSHAVPIIDKNSVDDVGFTGTGDPHPWPSGNQINYEVQAVDELAADTYYWRVKASDEFGPGAWSSTWSFEVSSGLTAAIVEAATATDAPTAAQIHNAGITEAASAADVQEATGIFAADLTEAGTAEDVPDGQRTTAAAIAEAASAAEVQTGSAAYNAGITEDAPATEVQSALVVRVADITEAGSASDNQSSVGTYSGAIVEDAPAADAQDAESIYTAGITEAVSASDAQTADIVDNDVEITEAAAAADSPSAEQERVAAIAEAGSALDVPDSSGNIFAAGIIESGTAAEVQTGSIDGGPISGVITETGAALDSCDAVLITNAGVIEAGSAAEVQDVSQISNVNIAEAGAAQDLLDASRVSIAGIIESAVVTDTQTVAGIYLAFITEAGIAGDEMWVGEKPAAAAIRTLYILHEDRFDNVPAEVVTTRDYDIPSDSRILEIDND